MQWIHCTALQGVLFECIVKCVCLLQVSKYLDSAGSKLNYRRYAETFFDILFAGGILGTFHSHTLIRPYYKKTFRIILAS